jgi:hypothetical protein
MAPLTSPCLSRVTVARALLSRVCVLVLEARFNPSSVDGASTVVVGHVIWFDAADNRPVVQPSFTPGDQSPPLALLLKLKYLVEATSPDSFHRLQRLRSQFWSFVALSSLGGEKGLS